MKLIWGFLLVSATVRQCMSWILEIEDLLYPSEFDYVEIKGQGKIGTNIEVFLYSVAITTAPIFLLSYLADKQL